MPELSAECWRRLPDAEAFTALAEAAARRWRLPPGTRAVAGTGSQALIQSLPLLFTAVEVAVLGPTYGEHARAWSAAGHSVREVPDLGTAAGAAVVVAVNPNNPDGRVLAPRVLAEAADRQAARGGLLVVDEAFGEEYPGLSVAPLMRPGLVVLKSFGKFFGLAGLRLGFALAEDALAARVGARLGPWAVSGPALEIGRKALADEGWSAETRRLLADSAARLDAILVGGGLEIVGGTGLFRLARHPAAGEIYRNLGRAGILVRAFAHRPDVLRFGLPETDADERRLARALAA